MRAATEFPATLQAKHGVDAYDWRQLAKNIGTVVGCWQTTGQVRCPMGWASTASQSACRFLQDHFVNLSRNLIFKWLRERRIKVDGVGIMQPNYRLTHQDYEITIPRATAVYVRPPRPQGYIEGMLTSALY